MKIASVFAHFDVDNILDENALAIIDELSRRCAHVELVTTSNIDISSYSLPANVEIRQRPNIGYDFYSYKTGLVRLLTSDTFDAVLLINSSFVVVDRSQFGLLIENILKSPDNVDAVGVTASNQISWHLQSYMLLLKRSILESPAFLSFIDIIQPMESKIKLILAYELGLSKLLTDAGFRCVPLLEFKIPDQIETESRRSENPCHVFAKELAQRAGLIKTEVLRSNQFGTDTSFLRELMSAEEYIRLEQLISRVRDRYSTGLDNISTLAAQRSALPAVRLASWHRKRRTFPRVAAAVHLYYIDLLDEIATHLTNITEPFDIFVTTPFEADVPTIFNRLADIAEGITVVVAENRGRDIGPFMALYLAGHLDRYDAVVKLHSKKSTYSAHGALWRAQLYGAILGTSVHALRSISLLRSGAGIVGPHSQYLTHLSFWGANKQRVRQMLLTMDPSDQTDIELGFFAGSMFWFRPDALSKLKLLSDDDLRFEDETGLQDGTLAHAFERVFCLVSRRAGIPVTTLDLNGQEISDCGTDQHRVPVL